MQHKNRIQNWLHYWKIAQARPDLKEFKDLLQVNANVPSMDLSENKIATKEDVIIDTPDGPKKVKQTVIKTFNQLLVELAPKENESGELN